MIYFDDFDDYDDVKAELLAERRAEQRYLNRLMAHPDPRDPDWPGPELAPTEVAGHDAPDDEEE